MTNPRSRRLAIIGTVLAVVLALFFLSIPLLAGVLARFVPASVADSIGKQVIAEARGNHRYCSDAAGLRALDALVDRLAAEADYEGQFHVVVVDADVLNAFAAPGGHMVVFRAILDEAADPQEFAGVLAHEMSHEIVGHPSKAVVKSAGYGVFSLLTPGGSTMGSQVAQQVVASSYSRDDELEADRRGVQLLNVAGIDSRGLARFFDTMHAKGGDVPGALEFMATHPTGEHRQTQLASLSREGAAALDDAQWQALRNVCTSTATEVTPVGS
jgi:predicted Zn-dependent protease